MLAFNEFAFYYLIGLHNENSKSLTLLNFTEMLISYIIEELSLTEMFIFYIIEKNCNVFVNKKKYGKYKQKPEIVESVQF